MKIIIELPYPLPTWNRILAMQHFQRMALRHWIHQSLSELSVIEQENTTLTVLAPRQSLTELSKLEYWQMIRPNKSRASRLKAERAKTKERRSKLNVDGYPTKSELK